VIRPGFDVFCDRRDRRDEVVVDFHAAIELQVQLVPEQPRDRREGHDNAAADPHHSEVAARGRVPNCSVAYAEHPSYLGH
jgi:hypothetical protein